MFTLHRLVRLTIPLFDELVEAIPCIVVLMVNRDGSFDVIFGVK